MYNRVMPLFKKYLVEETAAQEDDYGRPQEVRHVAGEVYLAIDTLKPSEQDKWSQLKHEADTVFIQMHGRARERI